MRKLVVFALMMPLLTVFADNHNFPKNPRDGQVFLTEGSFLAYDAQGEEWLDPVAFWRAYAERRGGLTWGQSADYPPYRDVSEQDLFMVELDSGLCLMEFWHSRWRRANDVRRWGDEFNQFGGCPDVFK
ncbi:MAG: hypothetical protein AAF438_22640 [Pseudomonadota bacterium]